jgi:putative radical SAM enzyme (TIGR03279 family)
MDWTPRPALISGIRRGSLAEAAGVEPGDAIVSLGGRVLRDVVDLQFYQAEPEVEVRLRKANGLEELLVFEKAIDEDLGFEFERATFDEITLCNNNCFFCFLKGLPRGMRKSLYLKDDDYRLSFLHGNFVTLTNLTEDDWARLEEQRLSPLNVSVHATERELRRRLLGNPAAPDVVEQLRRLGGIGIRCHTQIVLTPGVNDGANLERSVRDLAACYPAVQTISIVPVGASPKLEDWSLQRDGIELTRPTPEYARALIDQLRPLQRRFRREYGATIVQCSDEYYVTGDVGPPGGPAYDGFPQYENGVGMVRTMLDGWARTRRRMQTGRPLAAGRRVALACGTLIAPLLRQIAGEFSALSGISLEVVPVPNTVFGERVNVSGLLCGRDLVTALQGREADLFILPRPSLDYFGRQFLDSMTVEQAEAALGRAVAFASDWAGVLRAAAGREREQPGRAAAPNGAMWSEVRESLPAGAAWAEA